MNEGPKQSSGVATVIGCSLLWLFFVYLYWQILHFYQGNITNPILAGMYLVQFGVHEVSHIIFSFLPAVLTAAAGSFGEVAFTILIVIAAVRAKSYWALVFGLLWLMMAFISMGNYMADARAQAMPLAGPSPDPVHDWNFVFGELNWLNYDTTIGMVMKVIGWIAGAMGLLIGLWQIVKLKL